MCVCRWVGGCVGGGGCVYPFTPQKRLLLGPLSFREGTARCNPREHLPVATHTHTAASLRACAVVDASQGPATAPHTTCGNRASQPHVQWGHHHRCHSHCHHDYHCPTPSCAYIARSSSPAPVYASCDASSVTCHASPALLLYAHRAVRSNSFSHSSSSSLCEYASSLKHTQAETRLQGRGSGWRGGGYGRVRDA
jgi:hypothetical protein